MKEHPYQPGKTAFEPGERKVYHRLVSADGGHGSQIAVLVQPEVVLSSSDSLDIFCKILTLSDGYIGYLGVSVWITGVSI